jgi:hypothetical protein
MYLCGETDQAGTDTEAGTLASRDTHAGREDVQHGEDSRGGDGHRQDLIEGEGLPGDEDESQSNGDALNDILDDTGQKIVNVHLIYILFPDFLLDALEWKSLKGCRFTD